MKKIILLFGLIFALSSCYRRGIDEEFVDTATIPVAIDWTSTGLDAATDDENLYRSSVYLFANEGAPFDGATYREYPLNSATGGTIEVPIGEYSVIVFNNSTKEFNSNVSFRNYTSFDDFEYYCVASNTKTLDDFVQTPDIIGAWSTSNMVVTSDMVITSHNLESYYISAANRAIAEEQLGQLSSVEPELLTYEISFRIYSSMIKSAKAITCDLIGMPYAVKLGSCEAVDEPGVFEFDLESRTFDDDNIKTSGYISGSAQTFGLLPETEPEDETDATDTKTLAEDAKYYLEFRFYLIDEYVYEIEDENGNGTGEYASTWYWPTPDKDPYRVDVTDALKGGFAQTIIDINIDLGFEEDEYSDIPEIYSAGAFDPQVEDWGPEEDVDLVM